MRSQPISEVVTTFLSHVSRRYTGTSSKVTWFLAKMPQRKRLLPPRPRLGTPFLWVPPGMTAGVLWA